VADDPLAKPTVLPPPSGARIVRDAVYRTDVRGDLHLDVYRMADRDDPRPAVLLVNGDGPEVVITHAKDWGVYRAYGEHLAARGLVGVPFDHRSTQVVGRPEVAAEAEAALRHIRERASAYRIDADRIGVWAFSAAGAFALAPLLRERPTWLRAIAGFYTVWDLAPYRESPNMRPSEETIRAFSATAALGDSAAGLPPMLMAIADRDAPALVAGAEAFAARAREIGVELQVERHPTGQHGFDILDDDDRSREIIRIALDFFAARLRR
jgi:acetyl esterase/lipase